MLPEVTTQMLCYYLGVTPRRVMKWRNSGVLHYTYGGYTVAEIDRFLACYVRQGHLTWDGIVSGRHVLADNVAIQNEFQLEPWQLTRLLDQLAPTHAMFPSRVGRYDRVSFAEKLAPYVQPRVDAQYAADAMGYKNAAEARKAPGIELAPSLFREAGGASISKASFDEYLRTHLPPWVDPLDWLDDRNADPRPLVRQRKAAELLGFPVKNIHTALNEARAVYIARRSVNGGSIALVSPLWIQAWLEWDAPLAQHDLARLFGVDPNAIDYWVQQGWVTCTLPLHVHDGRHPYLLRSCWLHFLQNNCSPQIRPTLASFLGARLSAANPPQLLSAKQFAQKLGCSPKRVLAWMGAGHVPFIQTPGGTYRIQAKWLSYAASLL